MDKYIILLQTVVLRRSVPLCNQLIQRLSANPCERLRPPLVVLRTGSGRSTRTNLAELCSARPFLVCMHDPKDVVCLMQRDGVDEPLGWQQP